MAESQEKVSEEPLEGVPLEQVRTADPRTHYVELDSLRGIAILGVIICHIAGRWAALTQGPLIVPILGVNAIELFAFGNHGVVLFFLLSGYLLTWTEEKRAQTGVYSLRAYAQRRALRLIPAYYVAIVVVAVVWPFFLPIKSALIGALINATFLRSLILAPLSYPLLTPAPAFWSLTPEVVFYCLLPFIILKLPRLPQRLVLFGVLVLVSLATRVYMWQDSEHPWDFQSTGFTDLFFYTLPSTHLYLFLAGMLLRMLIEHLNVQPMPIRLQSLLASILFLTSTSLMVPFPYLFMNLSQAEDSPVALLVDLLVIAFFASALLGAPLLRGVLNSRPLAFIGMISYSLFVFQAIVILVCTYFYERYFFRGFADNLIAQHGWLAQWAIFSSYALVILAVAGVISYFSYRYIESPFLRYKPK
jgi:peptidoglycan/LPS O-acetylase OafA/YrhL